MHKCDSLVKNLQLILAIFYKNIDEAGLTSKEGTFHTWFSHTEHNSAWQERGWNTECAVCECRSGLRAEKKPWYMLDNYDNMAKVWQERSKSDIKRQPSLFDYQEQKNRLRAA